MTARNRADAAPGQHSHLRLEQFLQQVPAFAVIVDSEGLLRFANHVALGQMVPGTGGISYSDCFPISADQPVEQWFRQSLTQKRTGVFETSASDGNSCLHYVVPLPRRGTWQEVVYLQVTPQIASQTPQDVLSELRDLQRLVEAHEEHSQFVTCELHDGVAQALASAIMHCELLLEESANTDAASVAGLHKVTDLLKTTLADTRRLISGLRPAALDDLGLLTALEHLIAQYRAQRQVAIEWTHKLSADRLSPALEIGIYRIIQESLTNSLRYSGSHTIAVELVEEAGQIRIVCQDWGRGFDPKLVAEGHFGLKGIHERARRLGGYAVVGSRPGGGACIRVEVPFGNSAPTGATESTGGRHESTPEEL